MARRTWRYWPKRVIEKPTHPEFRLLMKVAEHLRGSIPKIPAWKDRLTSTKTAKSASPHHCSPSFLGRGTEE